MKEALESSPTEPTPQDKKNYATKGADKSISANNSKANSITIADEKQSRIAKLVNFFNQLYGKIPEPHFAYLWTKQRGIFPFVINDESQRIAMAMKAVELTNNGVDVWHSVNTVSVEPTNGKRGDESVVSYQTAIVTDIDIIGAAHKSTNLAANFDEAKSFLPIKPSILLNSGNGAQAYFIFDHPILINDENREELKRRNSLWLDFIRQCANGKDIDGVGDLPRVMRTPGTFNYKLGKNNAPLCHIVEDSGLRFAPDQIDERLNALIISQETGKRETISSQNSVVPRKSNESFVDDNEFNIFRIRRMLDFINPSTLTYDDWLAVGMALKNIGMDCSDWEQWSRHDERFKDGECQYKWNGFDRDGYDIGTLYLFASQNGYDAKEIFREWYELNTGSRPSDKKNTNEEPTSQIDSLKKERNEINKSLNNFEKEKDAALEKLRNLEKFDSETMFSKDIVTASAFAYLFDKQAFSNIKRKTRIYGDEHRAEKVSVNEWLSDVKDKANEIKSRQNDLKNRRSEIQAQISSLSFIATDDMLAGIVIPKGYSISDEHGLEKVSGESMITICRRPILITGKTFSVEEKIYKVTLAYKNSSGKWKKLEPTEKAIVFNQRKLVDLANADLPVTSQNAAGLVEYFDAFAAANEINFPLEYSVPRGGWYKFHGTENFADPRRDFIITDDDDKKISVKVNERSEFANGLQKAGSLAEWKKGYELAKKSPVARLNVAASVAPPLLNILGERNFMLYTVAPTRAGKTTALYLGASAVGSEKIIRSFDATKNGLIGAAADVSDYAFFVDEKQVADNRIREQLSGLVYAFGNGIGRTKLNKDSTLRKLQDWRTIAIATGETQLLPDNVTEGANTRLLTVNAPKVILSADDCKKIRKIIRENHGLVFPLIIDKIIAVGKEKLRTTYENLVDTFVAQNPNLLNEYCRYLAVLTLADALLNSVLGNSNAIDDAIIAMQSIFPLIPTTAEISDTAREKDFVLGYIAQSQNRFTGGNVPLDRMQSISGRLDSPDYIYITAMALKQACADAGFDYKKVVTDLVADGFFKPADKIEKGRRTPKNTVPQRVGSGSAPTVPCYRIRKDDCNIKD